MPGQPARRRWLLRLAGLPIPLLLALMLALWAANLRSEYESQSLLTAFNFLCSTVASVLVAVLVGRSYLARSSPGLLLLGCGVIIWGAAGTLVPVLLPHGTNALISGHNSLVWFSAICQLAGVLLSLRSWRPPRLPGLMLAVAYAGALCFVWLVTMLAVERWMPEFFAQGQGGTPLRTFILGSAIVMFALSAAVLWRANRPSPSAFVRWYGMAMLLIATGLLGIMLEEVHGGPLSWTGRAAQFLGGAYILVAAIASVRESAGRGISLAAALRASEERYAAFAAATFEGIVESEAGRVVDCNEQFARMHGWTVRELKGTAIADLVVPEDRERAAANIRENRESVIEHASFRKDGTRILVEAHGRPVAPGSPRRYTAVRDITQRKQADETLRLSAETFARTFHGNAAAMALTHIEDGRVVDANQRWLELTGLTREDAIGKTTAQHRIWKNPEDRAAMIRELEEHGNVRDRECTCVGKNGQEYIVLMSAQPITVQGARLLLTSAIDITDRKRAEEALRASERRLRMFYESGVMGMFSWHLDGRITEVNDRFLEMVGYTREDFAAGRLTWAQMTPPEYESLDRRAIEELKATGLDSPYEKEFIRKDGSRIPVLAGAATVSEDRTEGVAFILDITERKRAEEALRQAHERLALAQQSAGAGIWDWAIMTEKREWSPEMFRLFGLDPSQAKATFETWRHTLHPEDRQAAEERIRRAVANHERLESEYRIVLAAGHGRWISALGNTVYDAGGRPLRM